MTLNTHFRRHLKFNFHSIFICVILCNYVVRGIDWETRQRRGFVNNESKEDIYVQSVAVNGRIAGNSVSVSLRNLDSLDSLRGLHDRVNVPAIDSFHSLKGRRRRREDPESGIKVLATKLPPKSTDKQAQKDEPEEGKSDSFNKNKIYFLFVKGCILKAISKFDFFNLFICSF